MFQRFYHFLDLKSKHPGSDIPELDSSLKKIAEPDFDILSRHKSITNHFEKQFELKENSKVYNSFQYFLIKFLLLNVPVTAYLFTEEEVI